MKKILLLMILALFLTACTPAPVPAETAPPATTTVPTETTVPPTTAVPTVPPTTVPPTTVPPTTVPPTTVPVTTAPAHSDLYIEGVSVEEVLTAFNEVVLQIEYSDGDGDPSLVQKWLQPISYCILGEPTAEDIDVLEAFLAELNQVPGFPGIHEAEDGAFTNLTLSFLGPEDFRASFSEVVNGSDAWGACQFWYYTDTNELYDARIGYRTDIDRISQNSILLEEIVNTLGISDTEERVDSIVYQYSNDNLELSEMDWLILKLLYHPAMECGMDADRCEAVIRELYY